MKPVLTFFAFLCFSSKVFSQSSDGWHSTYQIDPIEVRYVFKETKDNASFYQVQLRLNKNSSSYKPYDKRVYYTFVLGLPNFDDETKPLNYSFNIYDSYEGVYTVPGLLKMRMKFDDGSQRYLDTDGTFKYKSGSEEGLVYMRHCKCEKYLNWFANDCRQHGYEEAKAVTLK